MVTEAEIKRKFQKISQEQWDSIFSILNKINCDISPQLKFYQVGLVIIDSSSDHELKSQIIELIYDNELIYPFDWTNWKEGVNFIENENHNYEEKDLIFLIKLLTLHVRKDRFCEGWLDQMLNDKTIFYILSAIKNKL